MKFGALDALDGTVPLVTAGDLEVAVTSDVAAVERGADPEVMARAEEVILAQTMDRMARLYERGDRAGAQRLWRKQKTETTKRAAKFGYAAKPNFTVENEAAISAPPKVDFGASK